ncbi:MAG: hypothetical protein ACLT98_15605 [Eggerthellaceae bacterium]
MNSSVHKLERTGFVELRVEQGRGTHLHLTEAGRALVEERVRPVAEAETAAFVAMGSRDSEELLRLTHLHLELLREQVEALPYPDGRTFGHKLSDHFTYGRPALLFRPPCHDIFRPSTAWWTACSCRISPARRRWRP